MILWLLTTLVATCGQKGPLYLPEEDGRPGQGVGADSLRIQTAVGSRSSSQ
jgi:predicted small lipoprotein YifL